MGLDPVRIVADDRESAGGVIAELRNRPDVSLVVCRLTVGDYLVGDELAVERKSLADFSQSVIDARLFRQVSALARGSRRPVLILEGDSDGRISGGPGRDALQGALIAVSVFYGLPVLRSFDAAETARLLIYLGRQGRQCARGGLPRQGCRPGGRRARQLFVLEGLPCIGPKRAASLLDHFGSVQSIATAPADALAGVDGLGEKIAARIRWTLE